MQIKKSLTLSLLYAVSLVPYFLSSYGFFYKSRPYLYFIVFLLVIYDLVVNIKSYKNNVHPPLFTTVSIMFLLTVEFISIFYSYNRSISIQLFVTNIFLISTLIVYLSQMDRVEITRLFQNILLINIFLYIVSVILLLFDYHLATTTRFGLYTFTGIFYGKQIGIVCLITIFSIDILRNNLPISNKRLSRFYAALYVVSVLMIILSFSRSVFLSLVIYWGILIVLVKRFRKYTYYYLALIIFMILIYVFRPFDRIIKYTVSDRQYFFNYAVHIFKHYLIRGNGYGCGKFLTKLETASKYLRHDLMGKQFHDSYFEIYFDTGLAGLIGFWWIIIYLFKRIVKYKMFLLMAMVISILFRNIFTSSLAYPSSISYFFSYILIIYGLVKEDDLSYNEYFPEE